MKRASWHFAILACAIIVVAAVGAFAAPPTVRVLVAVSQLPAEKNPIQEEIGKRVGIDFAPLCVELNDFDSKFNAMLASNTLPDIVAGLDLPKVREMAAAGAIIPLDGLLAAYGKDLTKNWGPYFNPATYIDGKKYYIPAISGYGQEGLAMRKDWLDNLGMKVPTTLDEYREVLKAFTTRDPNKNGKNDTIGLGVTMAFMPTFEHVFGAYEIAFQRDTYIDGKVVPYFLHPKYVDVLKYYHSLYVDGLMEPDFATIPNMSCLQKLWGGVYGAYDGNPVGTTNNWIGRYTENPKPVFDYTVLKGPSGKGGTRRLLEGMYGAVITSSSKAQANAMKLLNFLGTAEGDELTFLGIRGRHWDKDASGAIKYLPPYDANMRMHRDEGGYAYFNILNFPFGKQFQMLTPISQKGLKLASDNSLPDATIIDTPAIIKDVGTLFDDIMKEAFATLIVSNDVAGDYQKYVKKLNDAGIAKYVDQATAIYKREQGIK